MGARRPVTEGPQRGRIKCEFCGRIINSVASLRAHHRILHSQALKEKMKRAASAQMQKLKKLAPKAKPKNPKTTKESSVENNLKVAQKSKQTVVKQKSSTPTPQEMNKVVDKTKPEKAQETLELATSEEEIVSLEDSPTPTPAQPTKRSTYRSTDVSRQASEDSPTPAQPTKRSTYRSTDVSRQASEACYECSECQRSFKTTTVFNKHIEEEHSNLILSFFFMSKEEFIAWKKQLEASTKCGYVTVQELPKKTTYSCKEFMTLDTKGHPQFCPSTIVSNNTSGNKFNVDFYTCHFGHEHEKYNIMSILNHIQNAQPDDLYIKFQTLMENIVLDAAKVKIDQLKTLYNKAQELKATLNYYIEEANEIETESSSKLSISTVESTSKLSISTVTTNISQQDEISNMSMKTRKRSIMEQGTPAKRVKAPAKKSNTFSLADNKDDDKILKELDDPNKSKTTPQKIMKSTSFNDTYKEFIDKTIKNKKTPIKKKNVVKTKMGIFKPNWPNGVSPKKEKRSDKSSPRDERRSSNGKVVDIQYEVREQENDCNILVLKL